MKFCYVDESGHGDEPVLVAAGVIVDATRMHITKAEWSDLLGLLSTRTGRPVQEFKTRHFYRGNGIWHDLSGDERTAVIDSIVDWIKERKHKLVFAAIDKSKLADVTTLPPGLTTPLPTPWVLASLHLALGIQKEHQRISKNKGHTILVFDRQVVEESAYIALVRDAPAWTDTFYARGKKQLPFDQIVDVPYFADSTHIGLLQAADLFAYLLRHHAEVEDGYTAPKYAEEQTKLLAWANKIASVALARSARWPTKGACACATFYNEIAPTSLRKLG